MSIKSAMDDVEAFHVAACVPVYDTPVSMDNMSPAFIYDALDLRCRLLREEHDEVHLASTGLFAACTDDEQRAAMVKVADGLADLIYVCIGTALTLGIPLDRVWKEVHRSNMAKVQGGVRRREDGKILKPEGWTPPDVEGCLYGDAEKPSRGVYGWPKVPG